MSRKGLFRLLSLLTLVAGLALGQTLSAFAAIVFNQDVPFDQPVYNACVPEDVLTTSGVDGVYPPGLPVAKIDRIERLLGLK